MASRKSRNIYISKCFMAVRNCINIVVRTLLIKDTSLFISANCVTAGNLNARINPSSYLF